MVLPGRFRALQGIQGLSRTGGFGRFRCQWVNAQRFFLEEEFNSVFVNVDIIPLVLNSEAHKI